MKKIYKYDNEFSRLIKEYPLESPPADFTNKILMSIKSHEIIVEKRRFSAFRIFVISFTVLFILPLSFFSDSITSVFIHVLNFISKAALNFLEWIALVIKEVSAPNDLLSLAVASSIMIIIYLTTYVLKMIKENNY